MSFDIKLSSNLMSAARSASSDAMIAASAERGTAAAAAAAGATGARTAAAATATAAAGAGAGAGAAAAATAGADAALPPPTTLAVVATLISLLSRLSGAAPSVVAAAVEASEDPIKSPSLKRSLALPLAFFETSTDAERFDVALHATRLGPSSNGFFAALELELVGIALLPAPTGACQTMDLYPDGTLAPSIASAPPASSAGSTVAKGVPPIRTRVGTLTGASAGVLTCFAAGAGFGFGFGFSVRLRCCGGGGCIVFGFGFGFGFGFDIAAASSGTKGGVGGVGGRTAAASLVVEAEAAAAATAAASLAARGGGPVRARFAAIALASRGADDGAAAVSATLGFALLRARLRFARGDSGAAAPPVAAAEAAVVVGDVASVAGTAATPAAVAPTIAASAAACDFCADTRCAVSAALSCLGDAAAAAA